MKEVPGIDLDEVCAGLGQELELLGAMAAAGTRLPSAPALDQRKNSLVQIEALHRAHDDARSVWGRAQPEVIQPLLARIRRLAGQVLAQDQAWLRNLAEQQQTVRDRQMYLAEAQVLMRAYHRQRVNRLQAPVRLPWSPEG